MNKIEIDSIKIVCYYLVMVIWLNYLYMIFVNVFKMDVGNCLRYENINLMIIFEFGKLKWNLIYVGKCLIVVLLLKFIIIIFYVY